MRKLLFLIVIVFSCSKEIDYGTILGYQFYEGINFSEEKFLGHYEGNSYIMYFDTNEYPEPPEAYKSAIERKLYYGLEFLGDKTGYKHYPDTSIAFTWEIVTRTRIDTIYRIQYASIQTNLIINGPESYNPYVCSLDAIYDTLSKTNYSVLQFEWWTKDRVNHYYDSVKQEFEGYYIQAILENFEKK